MGLDALHPVNLVALDKEVGKLFGIMLVDPLLRVVVEYRVLYPTVAKVIDIIWFCVFLVMRKLPTTNVFISKNWFQSRTCLR